MKTKFIVLLRSTSLAAAIALGLAAPTKAATVVSLDPVTQNIAVGGTAFVNLNISGIGANAAPSLGAWLVEIAYNNAIVSASAVSFGTNLDLGILGSLQFSDLTTSGLAKADETSFEDLADLNNLQPGAFTLATFSFIGVAPGVSSLSFTRLELSDEIGFPLADFTPPSSTAPIASITVGTPTVPDAGSSPAVLAACLGLILFGQRWRARKANA